MGTTEISLINDENPYGLNPDDPNSKDDIIVMDADLHLEINQPVKVELRSYDVLHNFYVPQFRAKMDTLPGLVTYYWFTPIKAGDFEILCAEYCGTGHYAMRGKVLVDEKQDYSNWLAKQITHEKMLAKVKESKNEITSEDMQQGIITAGSEKIYLLSHNSAELNGRITLNTNYGIDQEKFVVDIDGKTNSLVRGEKLMELLTKIVSFVSSHTHAFPGLAPVPQGHDGTRVEDISRLLADAPNTILNQNIRIN